MAVGGGRDEAVEVREVEGVGGAAEVPAAGGREVFWVQGDDGVRDDGARGCVAVPVEGPEGAKGEIDRRRDERVAVGDEGFGGCGVSGGERRTGGSAGAWVDGCYWPVEEFDVVAHDHAEGFGGFADC